MKVLNKIYKKSILALVLAAGTMISSCTDYLTIIPSTKIVHENFWQTKDQVNGMLEHSYLKLISSDAVRKAIVWGELRADNMTYPANYSQEIKYIVEANILDENSFCQWGVFYEAINYANLVIEYAPLVVDRDPDFTEGDLEVVLGEMYAMRALCHFYLVRTFRDIPMALKPAANDAELPDYVQVHPMEALNYIMADLDRAENMVMKSGNYTTAASNYGRITKNAVLAIKADVNLWRAAFAKYYEGKTDLVAGGDDQKYYDECVQNCKDVLANMDAKLLEDEKDFGKTGEKFPYNLLQNHGDVKDKTDEHLSTVYDDIFGAKNSKESILELQVEGDNITNGSCLGVYHMYGTEGKHGYAVVPTNFLAKFYESDDLRAYSYTNATTISGGSSSGGSSSEKNDICIVKYSAKSAPASNYRKSGEFDANWILYRRTDVMLMMAEAMVARPSAASEDFTEAFNIVNAINKRSRIDTTNIKRPLDVSKYQTKETAIELVLAERTRELSYEGKRWYDLVRKALREGTTNNIKFVADKLDSNSGVVKSKMSSIDGLFFPIHIDELRYNKNLKQNPAYITEGESIEMN